MKLLLSMLLALLLPACFLAAADSISENAKRAISHNDFSLYQLATRGLVLPGLEIEQWQSAATLCGTKMLKGTGDIVKTEADLDERKALSEYAAQYNKIIYAACIAAKK